MLLWCPSRTTRVHWTCQNHPCSWFTPTLTLVQCSNCNCQTPRPISSFDVGSGRLIHISPKATVILNLTTKSILGFPSVPLKQNLLVKCFRTRTGWSSVWLRVVIHGRMSTRMMVWLSAWRHSRQFTGYALYKKHATWVMCDWSGEFWWLTMVIGSSMGEDWVWLLTERMTVTDGLHLLSY
jgi:hypothetical protein